MSKREKREVKKHLSFSSLFQGHKCSCHLNSSKDSLIGSLSITMHIFVSPLCTSESTRKYYAHYIFKGPAGLSHYKTSLCSLQSLWDRLTKIV